MKVPHKIRINSKTAFEVVWVERFDCPKTLGECRYHSNQIAIRVGMTIEDTIKTLIHETLHAICETNKIKISHTAIHQLDEAIYKVLKLNDVL